MTEAKIKTAAMLMVCAVLFGLFAFVLPSTAQAATIGCYDTGYRYNPNAGGLPYEFAAHWGLAYAYSSSGMPAYCIEMLNHEFYGGTEYYATTDPIGALSNQQRAMLAQILAHGYDGTTKYGGAAIEEQLATQVAVWLVATNNCWGGSGYDAVLNGFVPNTTIGYIARRIIDSCTLYVTVPSFTANNAASAPTYEMEWNESLQTYTISLNDTNRVLSEYNFSAPSGLSVQRSGNTLTVTGSLSNPSSPVTLTATKPVAYSRATIVYLYYGSAQIITYNGGTVGDPVQSAFKLKIKGGNLDLAKTSEDGIVEGMKFRVTCPANGYSQEVSTNANGAWRLTGLTRGTYTIEEIETNRRYYQPDPVTVEVLDGGRTASVSFYNDCKEDLKLVKTSEDGIVEGLKFHVTCAALGFDETVLTDANGEFLLKYLDPETYIIEEIETPNRYYKNDPVSVTVNRGDELVTVEFYNDCKEDLKLVKTSEDGIAEGLKFHVTCEKWSFAETVETDENGEWLIKYLDPGTYIVQEIEIPDRYKSQPPIEVVIERGVKLVEISCENKLKTAQVEMQKLSNHPEDMIAQGLYNKPLAGAVYGIYRADTDELITQMTTAGVMGKATSEVFKYAGEGEFYVQEITPPKYYAHDETKYPFAMTLDHELFVREMKNDTLIGKMITDYEEVDTDTTIPNTGDTNNIEMYNMVLVASVTLMIPFVIMLVKNKKKDKEETNEDENA